MTTDTVALAYTAFYDIGVGVATSGGNVVLYNTGIAANSATFLSGQASALIEAINHADMQSGVAGTAIPKFNLVQSAAANYITALSTQRSLLGAYQNQIEFTVSNLTELSSNLSAARSNVQDTDYASETASLTKGQILQQAATAMLAQANQMPNVILSLLK